MAEIDVRLAEDLVNARMAHYGYTPEQIEAASFEVDHYAAGCTLGGAPGTWDCYDHEKGQPTHPISDEFDRVAEFVVWVLENSPAVEDTACGCGADLLDSCGACGAVR